MENWTNWKCISKEIKTITKQDETRVAIKNHGTYQTHAFSTAEKWEKSTKNLLKMLWQIRKLQVENVYSNQ